MANHKSALKRAQQNENRRTRNRVIKTRVKSVTKAIQAAVAEKQPEDIRSALIYAQSMIAKAAKKGVIHRNTASRKISRLTRMANRLSS